MNKVKIHACFPDLTINPLEKSFSEVFNFNPIITQEPYSNFDTNPVPGLLEGISYLENENGNIRVVFALPPYTNTEYFMRLKKIIMDAWGDYLLKNKQLYKLN